jgi:hypothetical protein
LAKPAEPQKIGPLDRKANDKAINAPASVDESKFGLKTRPAPPDDGKRGLQTVIINSGTADGATSGKFDPHKNGYGERPEGLDTRSPEFAKRVSEDAGKALEIEPSKNENVDPDRFKRKGAIYYDENLGQTLERDTDTSGQMTHKKAKDTLRRH